MLPRAFSIEKIKPEDRNEAKQVVIFTIVVSFLPLVVSFAVLAFPLTDFNLNNLPIRIWGALRDVFFSGQLYFYAMSICGTMLFISHRDGLNEARWMRLWTVAFVLFCVAFMVVFITQNNNSPPKVTFHSFFSVVFFAYAVLLNYRVMLLCEQSPETPETTNRGNAEALTLAAEPDYDK
jgi:hypothetical protein